MNDPLPPLTDDELRPYLEIAFADVGLVAWERHPHEYRSSFPIDRIVVTTADGRTVTVLYKDLRWGALTPAVQAAKPRFLYNPRREIVVYRDLLERVWPAARPARFAAIEDDARGYFGFITAQAGGIELYQHGDLAVWQAAARWLAHWHARGQAVVNVLPSALTGELLRYDHDYLLQWNARAERIGGPKLPPPQRAQLPFILDQHRRAVELLSAQPRTVVHGEFYASNVFVDDRVAPFAVSPVDWELTGIGPAYLDLAALTAGKWSAENRAALVAAYGEEWQRIAAPPPSVEFARNMLAARLHLAVQWLGWSAAWQPPDHQRHDWLAEAATVAAELASWN